MFLKHSIDDVFSGAFALAFLSPLVVLHNLRWDFSSRMAASRRAKSTFEDNPLNFKIYAIDAALTVATLLVYAGVFDLVLYLQVNRN